MPGGTASSPVSFERMPNVGPSFGSNQGGNNGCGCAIIIALVTGIALVIYLLCF